MSQLRARPSHPNATGSTIAALLLAMGIGATPSAASAGGPQAEVEGALDKGQIREVVRAHIDEVRHCYNVELKEQPEVGGRIVVAFTIDAEGLVRDARSAESTMPPRFDHCLVEALGSWQFPAPANGGKVKVRYPFQLEPG